MLEAIFIRSWWVILFALCCLMFFEQAHKKLENDFSWLHTQLEELQKQKQESLAMKDCLTLQINSQSDPAWVELVLMKGLGVVPEKQYKVFFTK